MRVLLIDDERWFRDGNIQAIAEIARSSAEGQELLARNHGKYIDELWLDYSLKDGDTIQSVVRLLVGAAQGDSPFNIGVVYAHTGSPSGARYIVDTLTKAGYKVEERLSSEALVSPPD